MLGRPQLPGPLCFAVLTGALLDRAEQFIADKQWDDAIAALTRLLSTKSSAVIAVDDNQYVCLAECCHRLLSRFPAEALERYRQLVDASSESAYRKAVASRDEHAFQRVVDQSFCSRWGDDALLALGELALERGDYQAARNAWSLISPQLTLDSQIVCLS